MQNLYEENSNIRAIKKDDTAQCHHSFVFMSGIAKNGRIFDEAGDVIEGKLVLTPNFTTELVSMYNNEMVIKWNNAVSPFDYAGYVAIKDEIVYIDTTVDGGIGRIEAVGENLLKIKQM